MPSWSPERLVFVEPALQDFNVPASHFIEDDGADTGGHCDASLRDPLRYRDLPAIAKENDCVVIEDCAQCLGAEYNGRPVGTFGDFTIVSFNYEKHLTTGEGGMLAVNNPAFLGDVERVVGSCTRVPLHDEKCYVYGMLVQHTATEREVYRRDLLAYFGQNCCRDNPDIFGLMDDMVLQGEPWEDIQTALLPHVEREIERASYAAPHEKRGREGGAQARGEARSRVFCPPIRTIGTGHLLGSLQASWALWARWFPAVNAAQPNARLVGAMQDTPGFPLPGDPPGKVPAVPEVQHPEPDHHPLSLIVGRARDQYGGEFSGRGRCTLLPGSGTARRQRMCSLTGT